MGPVFTQMNTDLKDKRILCIKMKNETSVKGGDEGTIQFVDDIGNIHVNWDNGSTLSILPDVDKFVIKDFGIFKRISYKKIKKNNLNK